MRVVHSPPYLEVGDGESPHLCCARHRLDQPGHLVLLHLDPVLDQARLLQLADLGAEPAVNASISSCFSLLFSGRISLFQLLILVCVGRVLGQSKGYTEGGERLVHDGHVRQSILVCKPRPEQVKYPTSLTIC